MAEPTSSLDLVYTYGGGMVELSWEIPNPDFDPDLPEDPDTNPRYITVSYSVLLKCTRINFGTETETVSVNGEDTEVTYDVAVYQLTLLSATVEALDRMRKGGGITLDSNIVPWTGATMAYSRPVDMYPRGGAWYELAWEMSYRKAQVSA